MVRGEHNGRTTGFAVRGGTEQPNVGVHRAGARLEPQILAILSVGVAERGRGNADAWIDDEFAAEALVTVEASEKVGGFGFEGRGCGAPATRSCGRGAGPRLSGKTCSVDANRIVMESPMYLIGKVSV